MDTLPWLQQPHFHVGSHVTQVECCCFSPDGSTILSGSCDNTLKLWRTRDGSLINTLNGHTDRVNNNLTFMLVLMSHRSIVVVSHLMVPQYCLVLVTRR